MSQKANSTMIGAFVFGAITIAVGAVLFFGSADLFLKKTTLRHVLQAISQRSRC